MSDFSEAEIELLIGKLANESIVEPTEIDRLLANPPVTCPQYVRVICSVHVLRGRPAKPPRTIDRGRS